MEKYLIWYLLSLKDHLKKRGSYLAVFGMIFLVWLVSGISIPSYKNMQIGISCGDSLIAKQIKEELISQENAFSFVEYEEQDELTEDVTNGKIDCGFVFSENFDEMFEKQTTKDAILYITTPFSTKAEVLKEKVYVAIFKLHSEQILLDAETKIFKYQDEERTKQLLEKNRLYLQGNDIFQMEIDTVNSQKSNEKTNVSSNVVSGLVGLSIFLMMFLSYGMTQRKEGDNVELALIKKEQFYYRFIKMTAVAFLPSFCGFILIVNTPQSRGFFIELFLLIVFVLLSSLWISVVGKCLGRAEYLSRWILSLLLLHMIVCPIFFDCAKYVPAIAWIRWVVPLGIYLNF